MPNFSAAFLLRGCWSAASWYLMKSTRVFFLLDKRPPWRHEPPPYSPRLATAVAEPPAPRSRAAGPGPQPTGQWACEIGPHSPRPAEVAAIVWPSLVTDGRPAHAPGPTTGHRRQQPRRGLRPPPRRTPLLRAPRRGRPLRALPASRHPLLGRSGARPARPGRRHAAPHRRERCPLGTLGRPRPRRGCHGRAPPPEDVAPAPRAEVPLPRPLLAHPTSLFPTSWAAGWRLPYTTPATRWS